jgi:hypothetical protein
VTGRGARPRYAPPNLRPAAISPELVARILALVPPKAPPAQFERDDEPSFSTMKRAKPSANKRPSKQHTQGTSGTARKASSAKESTLAARIEDRVPPQPEPENGHDTHSPAPTPAAVATPPVAASAPAGTQCVEAASISEVIGRGFRESVAPAVRPIVEQLAEAMPRAAENIVAVFREAAARSQVAHLETKPVLSIGRSETKRAAPIGWIEQRMASIRAARAGLERKGFKVTRADRDAPIARWFVSGYTSSLSDDELLEVAKRRGCAS